MTKRKTRRQTWASIRRSVCSLAKSITLKENEKNPDTRNIPVQKERQKCSDLVDNQACPISDPI
jgi:hypothetical protein